MAQELEIHFSEVQSWLRCERQHFNKYRLKLALATENENLGLGRLWHEMIVALHTEGYKAAWHLWDTATGGEMLAAGDYRWLPDMLHEYHKWYMGSGYRVKLLEKELRIPYTHPLIVGDVQVVLVGTIDRLYSDASGQYWIGEDKTTGGSHSDRHLLTDPQGLTYKLMAYELDIPTVGVLYTQARKVNPATARVPVVKSFEVPFSDMALSNWATNLDRVMPAIVAAKLAPEAEIEASAPYRFNPLSWMSCYCDFEELCKGQLHGNKSVSDFTDVGVYKVQEQVRK